MFRDIARTRSTRQVLDDRSGSSIAEGLGGVALILMVVGALAFGVTTNVQAVSTIATKAERQALISSLVGDEHAVANWGTPASPHSETVTLPNGHDVKITTWREVTPVSTRLTAVSPISADTDAADCSTPSAVAKSGCIYATRLHAKSLDGIAPHAIVRKDPSMGAGAPIGTVDARVGTASVLSQGQTIASGKDTQAGAWRYLVEARSADSSAGEIEIRQGTKSLAKFPVSATEGGYYGTFNVPANTVITAVVTSGNVNVKTVFFYRAGGTS